MTQASIPGLTLARHRTRGLFDKGPAPRHDGAPPADGSPMNFDADKNREELIDGTLYTSPAPAREHLWIQKRLEEELDDDARRGERRPRSGWVIQRDPELTFRTAGQQHRVRPDLAGWRFDELPAVGSVDTTIEAHKPVPDWVCEVLSPGNTEHDTERKARLYAAAGIAWYWIIDPRSRTVGAYKLVKGAYRAEIIGSSLPGAATPLPAAVPPFLDRLISWDDVFAECRPPGAALTELLADLPAPAGPAKKRKK